jgi:hypothetical protein
MSFVPILVNHDREKAIGMVEAYDGRFEIFLLPSACVTLSMLFEVFGNSGIRIIESDGEYVRRAEILEFSLPGIVAPAGSVISNVPT